MVQRIREQMDPSEEERSILIPDHCLGESSMISDRSLKVRRKKIVALNKALSLVRLKRLEV
jgi:hypothetical protein